MSTNPQSAERDFRVMPMEAGDKYFDLYFRRNVPTTLRLEVETNGFDVRPIERQEQNLEPGDDPVRWDVQLTAKPGVDGPQAVSVQLTQTINGETILRGNVVFSDIFVTVDDPTARQSNGTSLSGVTMVLLWAIPALAAGLAMIAAGIFGRAPITDWWRRFRRPE